MDINLLTDQENPKHPPVDGHHPVPQESSNPRDPHPSPSTLIWGIYNPLVAYIGMFLTTGILTTTVHHATSSRSQLKEKMRFMEARLQIE